MEHQHNPLLASVVFIFLLTFISLWLANILGISLPISITNRTVSGELSVVGVGKVDIVPDTAQVSAGITVSNAKTAQEASQKMSEANNKIISAITALGIQKADITTSNYSVNPDYSFEPNGKTTPQTYSGNATVTIKVKDTSKVSGVIAAATDAGATNVQNLGFSVDDPSKFQEEARNKAIADAKSQAQKLASQLGIHLGKITNFVESNGNAPQPMTYNNALDAGIGMAKAVTPPTIEPGTQSVTSTVTLYFDQR